MFKKITAYHGHPVRDAHSGAGLRTSEAVVRIVYSSANYILNVPKCRYISYICSIYIHLSYIVFFSYNR